jgi:uncharacterized protein (DUF1015 family)
VTDLAPFRALRYAPEAGDLARLLAPPYDVIDPELAADLRERSPHNAVRLVLPEGPDPGRYARAADRLADWRATGILRRDKSPALYAYEQSFELEGERLRRRALFGALRLTDLDQGEVLPHEETHAGPKEDRSALLEATLTQLSAVLLLGRDPDGELRARLAAAIDSSEPEREAVTPDGIRHRLWRLPGSRSVERLTEPARVPSLLIADGHHRYETALAFRDRHPELSGAARVLAAVVPDSDPGLVSLPTHRSLTGDDGDGPWRSKLARVFEIVDAGMSHPPEAARGLEDGAAPLALVDGDGGSVHWLRPRPRALAAAGFQPEGASAPPLLFDRLVLRRCFGLEAGAAVSAGRLGYHRDARGAAEAAGRDGAAFLLAPLRTVDLWDLVRAGGRLPPKSTYFWPKLPSGLLFRPLEDTLSGRT